jgi:hypothetical protein
LHVVYSAGGLLPRERQNSVVSFSWKHMVHRLRPVRDSVAVFNVDAIYFLNDNIGRNAIIPSDMIRVFRYTAVKKAGKFSVVCACKLTSVFQDFYFREFFFPPQQQHYLSVLTITLVVLLYSKISSTQV